MPRAGQTKPPVTPPVGWIAIGVLTRTFPPELVDRVIAKTGRGEQRQQLLPARVVVYYTLAMCLFAHVGYEEVMRLLAEGLAWARPWRGAWQVPDKSSIARARARLGPLPLRELFAEVVRPLATKATSGGVPAGAAGGAGGVRHACGHGRGHGRTAPGREVAVALAGAFAGAGDAAAGRPGPVRPGAMAHLPGDGGGVGVALPPGRQAGGAGGLRGWLVARRAGPQPAREQTGRGAGGGLPPGRSWPRGRAARVSADHHNPYIPRWRPRGSCRRCIRSGGSRRPRWMS